LAVAAVALLLGAVSSCGSAAGMTEGDAPPTTSALVAHQLLWRHRLASGWAYLIGQRIRPLITAQLVAIADGMTGR
jgi:hypothetical protein